MDWFSGVTPPEVVELLDAVALLEVRRRVKAVELLVAEHGAQSSDNPHALSQALGTEATRIIEDLSIQRRTAG